MTGGSEVKGKFRLERGIIPLQRTEQSGGRGKTWLSDVKINGGHQKAAGGWKYIRTVQQTKLNCDEGDNKKRGVWPKEVRLSGTINVGGYIGGKAWKWPSRVEGNLLQT